MTKVPPIGFRMPAEWEPHKATWIAWPHNVEDWPDRFAPIPWVYADIVRHLHEAESVCILVQNAALEKKAKAVLRRVGVDLSRVSFAQIKTDRVWTRDFAPIFIAKNKPRAEIGITNWRFNAWAKYRNWRNDDAVTNALLPKLKVKEWQPIGGKTGQRIVLEGGSIDVNGRGILLTTEECLLSSQQERNPGLSRSDYERVFAEYLGIRKVIWLKKGIAGDDTHGHVDDLARFTDVNTIVIASEGNKADENFEPLRENLLLLRRARNLSGKPFKVLRLPMPVPVIFDGQRLPASYANFYVANGLVLVPTFNDRHDSIAIGILQKCFPKRKVVGIHCLDLVWGLGTLHCMTQQQPTVTRS